MGFDSWSPQKGQGHALGHKAAEGVGWRGERSPLLAAALLCPALSQPWLGTCCHLWRRQQHGSPTAPKRSRVLDPSGVRIRQQLLGSPLL